MKTQSAKSKGRNAQQEVKKIFLEHLKQIGIYQSHYDDLIRSTSMGAPGSDLEFLGELQNFYPFDIEIKHHKTITALTPIKQAEERIKRRSKKLKLTKDQELIPLAILREDRDQFYVVLQLQYFLEAWAFICKLMSTSGKNINEI